MRIAYVAADHGTPVFGNKGASVHIQELVRALNDLGHELTIIAARTGDHEDAFPAHVVPVPISPDVAAIDFDMLEGRERRFARERRFVAASQDVERTILTLHREAPFDFIYERYSLWSTAGVRAARAAGIPCIVEVNAPLLREQTAYRRLILSDEAAAIEAEVFGTAYAIAAVSENVKRYVVAKGAPFNQVQIVPNAVDVTRFDPKIPPEPIEKFDDAFVIGFAGSLKPWHGLECLMEAFADLSGRRSDCRLLIVGDGRMRPWIEGFAHAAGLSDRIMITGWVPHRRLPGYLRRMDVAVAPYQETENFYFSPLKLFEYLAAGVPVVASGVGQVADVIDDDITGLLSRPGDPRDLADKIDRLHSDPELRRELGVAASLMAAQHTWQQVAERIVDLAVARRCAA